MYSVIIDTETAPIPQEHWTSQMKDRFKRLYKKNRAYYGEDEKTDKEVQVLTASLDPMLGYVCCISVCSIDGNKEKPPVSFAGGYKQEKQTLTKFFKALEKMPDDVLYITFCGKFFDGPFLSTRAIARGVDIGKKGRNFVSSRSPYHHIPHFDIQNVFGRDWRLIDVCDLMGVKSPKDDVDGSQVWLLAKEGKFDLIAKYCEGDVIATRAVYKVVRWKYNIFPYRRPKKDGDKGNWKGKGKSNKGNKQKSSRPSPPLPESEY